MSVGWFRHAIRRGKWVVRAVRGRDLFSTRQVRLRCLHLGSDGASWCVCPDGLGPESVVYSVGVGDDVSFDLELIRMFGATVHAFDPTPRSQSWLATQALSPRFVFHPVGLASFDGTATFSPPDDDSHVSFSTVKRRGDGVSLERPVRRLASIASDLHHRRIDLLKMDIEGAEYAVIDDILSCGVPIDQLLIEFHHRWNEVGISRTRDALRKLAEADFRIFDVSSSGEEYGFIRAGSR